MPSLTESRTPDPKIGPNSGPSPSRRRWARPVAVLAAVFGLATLISGGAVLFGPDAAQTRAGDYMPFIVWFNFLAGALYLAAALGLWFDRSWTLPLARWIAALTAGIALIFAYRLLQGAAFEMRTIGALALRIGFWAAIALALGRSRS